MDSQQFIHTVDTALHDVGITPAGPEVGVALSGGPDSVSLLLAMHAAGYRCVALHCNFGLRGAESDGDTDFVTRLCAAHGIPLEQVRFDVAEQSLPGESTEMACRRLRYDWFADVAARRGLAAVALGHHLDDSVETVMLNLLRGTGPRGMRGIAAHRDIYVRPMLGLTRADIDAFYATTGLERRIDSTNASTDYRRNALRIDVLPLVHRHFPGADGGLRRTMATMASADDMLDDYLEMVAARAVIPTGINVDVLRRMDLRRPAETLLLLTRRVFGRGGCSEPTVASVIACHRSGARFATVDGRPLELRRGILRLL